MFVACSYPIQDNNQQESLVALNSKSYFQKTLIINSLEKKLFLVKLRLLGKIFCQIADFFGKKMQFVTWAIQIKGKVLSNEESISILNEKITLATANNFNTNPQKNSETATSTKIPLKLSVEQPEKSHLLNKQGSIPDTQKSHSDIQTSTFHELVDSILLDYEETLSQDQISHSTENKNLKDLTVQTISQTVSKALPKVISEAIPQTPISADQFLQTTKEEWDIHIALDEKDANQILLSSLISHQEIHDIELYRFFIEKKIEPKPWFIAKNGEPTDVGMALLYQRGIDPITFFSHYKLIDFKESWLLNVTMGDNNKNSVLLKALIEDASFEDKVVLDFFKEFAINPESPIFDQLDLKQTMKQKRVELFTSYFPQSKMADPNEHMISMNCHGHYSKQYIELPENIYVLAPHPKGFDVPYIFAASKHSSVEELIYQKQGEIPMPTSGGWHMYKPGNKVRNVQMGPWVKSKDGSAEFLNWAGDANIEDISFVKGDDDKIPDFAFVPARDQYGQKVVYKKKEKTKVKVFNNTSLHEVILSLSLVSPSEPKILVLFCCNSESDKDPEISISSHNKIQTEMLLGE